MAYMKLKSARVELGKTQLDMANLLGIAEPTYNKKENGIRCFTLPEAQILAKFFNMDIEVLFLDNDVHSNKTKSA